ncbi:hypothetical protein [Lysinibacillus phage vB_LspM-01]|nr:hypothetical protein [Lysinibacillus phage vB_LspM-01]
MPFNKPLPEWKNPGVKPNQGLIDAGWKPDDKPPADVHNWWMNTSYVALEQLQNEAINKDQIGVANGVAPLGDDGKVPASMVSGNTAEIETQLENHINKDLGHVRFAGGASGQNAMVISIPNAIVRNPDVANPIPETGYAFRFVKNTGANNTNVTLQIDYGNGKTSLAYPVLYPDGKQLSSGAIIAGGIYTVAFSGTSFFLQGSGSGVTAGTQASRVYATAGSFNLTVPEGVTRIIASIWGAGGGGGGVSSNNVYGGGGGGAGFFKEVLLQVLPRQNLTIQVGSGGRGGAVGASGLPGQMTFIQNALNGSFYVYGGGGGGAGQASYAGYGGDAASQINTGSSNAIAGSVLLKDGTVTSIPQIDSLINRKLISGGTGSYGSSYVGGGGGGSPSDMYPGASGGRGNASNAGNAGGVGFYATWFGGRGGEGQSSVQADGSYGAGGGGGSAPSNGATSGGNGGDGLIILVW